jgi:hypothetical protein
MRYARFGLVAIPALLCLGLLGAATAQRSPVRIQKVDGVQEKGGIRVSRVERSPDFLDARVQIKEPANNAVLPEGQEAAISVDVAGYTLGVQTDTPRAKEIANSAMGQHVHVIVDNEPYLAFYDASKPLPIGKLAAGAHTIRVFPSRSYHESVKHSGAFVRRTVYVGQAGQPVVPRGQPMLTYSRPKGDYVGQDMRRILLDFYLSGAQLGDRYKVRLGVDDQQFVLSEWTPYYIEGLKPGQHQIKLELIDAQGQVVPGAYNSTTRAINLKSAAAAGAKVLDACCPAPEPKVAARR